MKLKNKIANQLDLFKEFLSGQANNDLPILYPNTVSYSSLRLIETCAYRYWLLYPGNWRGWETDAPYLVQQAYWQKRLINWYAWAGKLVHEFTADVLFNQIDRAISDFTKTIEINPRDALAYANRGEGYFSKKKYDEARNDFRKAQALGLKIDPKFLEMLR